MYFMKFPEKRKTKQREKRKKKDKTKKNVSVMLKKLDEYDLKENSN